MALIGLSSTLIQLSLYASVNYIVPEKHYGLAYGIMQALANIGQATGPILIGSLLDVETNRAEIYQLKYSKVHAVLMFVSGLGVFFAIIL